MKTAIDLLEEELSEWIHYKYEKAYEQHQEVNKIFEKAKQLEKEQIINAFKYGWNWNYDAEKYYNETYKKEDWGGLSNEELIGDDEITSL